MGKVFTQTIDRFDGGMTNDPRIQDFKYSQLIKNFDAHTYPQKIVPYRSSESGDAVASTNKIVNFTYGFHIQQAKDKLFGLGVSTGVVPEVFEKGSETTPSYTDDAWFDRGGPASGARDETFFMYYKGYVYGARAGTHLWRLQTHTPGTSDTWQALTYTSMAQGLIHSKDDILYVPYNNDTTTSSAETGGYIATISGTSFVSATALTLPGNMLVTSICEYGNYLAIACRPKTGVGKSVVYLWDRDSSLTTLSESIDWGQGVIQILEQVGGYLIGISVIGGTSTTFGTKVVFRAYNGGRAEVFKQFFSNTSVAIATTLPLAKQKVNDTLYFLMSLTLNGVLQEGLWKLGKTASGFSIVLDRTPNNDTALSSGSLWGFFVLDDYVFISYSSSAAYAMSKTDDQANFASTAIYDTQILNAGDSSITKKLISVTLMHEPLPANGKLTVKYKKDEETSFTTIFSNTTDNSISHTAINIESSGATLPEFKEITFSVESTQQANGTGAAAVLTGIKFKYEIIDKDIA